MTPNALFNISLNDCSLIKARHVLEGHEMKFENFDDLPEKYKKRLTLIKKDKAFDWVLKEIPALNNMTIVEVLNQSDGEKVINEFLQKIEGYFRT